jgi:hypothetical protein
VKRPKEKSLPAVAEPSPLADRTAVGLLVLFLVAVFGDVLFLGRCFFVRDLTSYHYPMKKVLYDLLWSGQFPLWNPIASGGQPIAANPAYELFYPPQWLIFLPGFHYGYILHIWVHFVIAAVGMYALLRSMDLKIVPSLFGSISFALGGPLLSLLSTLPFFFSVSWMPLILLFARRSILRPNTRDMALAAVLMGLQALIGEPVTVLQTAALIVVYALDRGWRARDRVVAARAVSVGAAILAGGLLLASAQLLPGFDHARDTVRSQTLGFEGVAVWSMHPARPLELFFPELFRHLRAPATGYPLIATLYPIGPEAFIADLYVGIVGALLAVTGLLTGKRGAGLVGILLFASYYVALGNHTPLLRFLYDVHLFRSIRFPEKFAITFGFVMIVWSAMVLDDIVRGNARTRRTLIALLGIWGLVAVAVATSLDRSAPKFAIFALSSPEVWSSHWLAMLVRTVVGIFIVVHLGDRGARVWGMALLLFLAADLAHLQWELAARMPRRFFESPSLSHDSDWPPPGSRLFHQAQWEWDGDPQTAQPFFGGVARSTHFWLLRNGLFPRMPWSYGVGGVLEDDIDRTMLLPTRDFLAASRDLARIRADWQSLLLPMAGATHRARLIAHRPEIDRSILANPESVGVIRVEETTRYPRYYFADAITAVDGERDFVNRLGDTNPSLRGAYVGLPFKAFAPASGTVDAVRERASEIHLSVTAAGRAFLIASVTSNRYWRATIDGNPVSLEPTNIGFQGMVVPPGSHLVEMRYRNPLVSVGIAISLVVLAALGLLIARPDMLRGKEEK